MLYFKYLRKSLIYYVNNTLEGIVKDFTDKKRQDEKWKLKLII